MHWISSRFNHFLIIVKKNSSKLSLTSGQRIHCNNLHCLIDSVDEITALLIKRLISYSRRLL